MRRRQLRLFLATTFIVVIAGCHRFSACETDDSKYVKWTTQTPSPDKQWEVKIGSKNIAGGFGTGSYIEVVYLHRIATPEHMFEVIEISEDENGNHIDLTANWLSPKRLELRHKTGIVDLQVTKLAGLDINLVSEGTEDFEKPR